MKTIEEGPRKYVTIDRKRLMDNQKFGVRIPPIWICIEDDFANVINATEIHVKGECKIIYGNPRICGALVWVETESELEYE